MANFVQEIKRRKVAKVAAVYAVVAWLIVQIVGAIAAPLNLPPWFDTVVIVLLGIGFPIALILAWAYDITPQGIRAAAEVSEIDSMKQLAGQRFGAVSQVLVLLAVGFLLVDQYLMDRPAEVVANNNPSSSLAQYPVNRFALELPDDLSIRNAGGGAIDLSPDGRNLVYATGEGLYLRAMDSLDARLLSGTEGGEVPAFSPDGQAIVYESRDGGLESVSINGGDPIPLYDRSSDLATGGGFLLPRWAADGTILFYDREKDGIYRLPEAGGDAELLIEIESSHEAYGPTLLPGGDGILFALAPRGANSWDNSQVVVESIASGTRRVLIENGKDPRFLNSGRLLFTRGNVLYGVAFDSASLTVTGDPVPLMQGMWTARPGTDTPSSNYVIADDGTLAYLTGASAGRQRGILVWVDRDGNEEALGFEPRIITYPRLSPDGSRVTFATREQRQDIWVGDLTRRSLTRLAPECQGLSPVWSPDGSQLYYGCNSTGIQSYIARQYADGATAPEALFTPASDRIQDRYYPRSISRDGSLLFVSTAEPPRDIGFIRLGSGNGVERLLSTPASEETVELSPDGRWLAYDSDESGRFEVYVRSFPDTGRRRIQLSTDGGVDPTFSRDGRELFYGSPGTIMSVSIRTGEDGEFQAGTPQPVVQGNYLKQNAGRQYDVSSDGQRFLMIKPVDDSERPPSRIVIVQNWTRELQRLTPDR